MALPIGPVSLWPHICLSYSSAHRLTSARSHHHVFFRPSSHLLRVQTVSTLFVSNICDFNLLQVVGANEKNLGKMHELSDLPTCTKILIPTYVILHDRWATTKPRTFFAQ